MSVVVNEHRIYYDHQLTHRVINAPHEDADQGLVGPKQLHLLVLHSKVFLLQDARHWYGHCHFNSFCLGRHPLKRLAILLGNGIHSVLGWASGCAKRPNREYLGGVGTIEGMDSRTDTVIKRVGDWGGGPEVLCLCSLIRIHNTHRQSVD